SWEPTGFSRDTRMALEKKAHVFAERGGYIGDAQGVMIDQKSGIRLGASDPRLGGVPVGY
ncbi:MAG TPA: gamma-glutamyltransferase, partial [Blastocatellia bacterium]|nr:gamma-glutamyltransferase [Blastocatellia bacterium]